LIPTGSRVLELNGLVSLNTTASYIWQLLDGRQSTEDITTALADRFAVSRDEAHTDVQEFLAHLEEMGLLVHEAPSP